MQISKNVKRMIKGFVDGILPLCFWVTLIFSFDEPHIAILTILCAILHECGHLFAHQMCRSPTTLNAKIYGFRLKRSKITSYKSRIFIALAGPVSNLSVFFALLLFGFLGSEYVLTFALVNLATALSNLLPIEGYDGYVALFEFFSSYEKHRLLALLYHTSFVLTALLCLMSLCLIDKFGQGYWFFAVFFISLLSKVGKRL